jgi:hypothetical protein
MHMLLLLLGFGLALVVDAVADAMKAMNLSSYGYE